MTPADAGLRAPDILFGPRIRLAALLMHPDSEAPGSDGQPKSTSARVLFVTFLGAIVRRMDDWMPIAAAVSLLDPLGLDSTNVRTAAFRLKRRGWLAAQTRDGQRGYALTEEALEVLRAGDEIVWHTRQPANLAAGWCVVSFSVPESQRAKRQKLRAHLAFLGFGNVSTAVWIAPARMLSAAERAIRELGLVSQSAIFVGGYAGGEELTTLLHRGWDLDGMNAEYRQFIEEFAPIASVRTHRAEDDYVRYVRMVDRWRRLAFRDPGLPLELMRPGWLGEEAAALYTSLIGSLEERAISYAASRWA